MRTEKYEYKCIKFERNKIVSKSAEKLRKYMILCKDLLTFLGLDYRDALLTTLYLTGIIMQSLKSIEQY